MKPFYSRYVASLGALLLLALSLVGCRDTLLDRAQPDPASPEQIGDGGSGRLDGAVTVSLTYDTPALRLPQTRTLPLSVEQESELKLATTRVMIFKSTGEYLRDAKVTKITPKKDHQQGEITFLALPGEGLTFVVLANLSEKDKVKKVSGTKAEVLKNFEYTVTADTDFAKTGLPMWGELAQQTIDPDVSAVQTIGTIHLLRAVARVDVGLNMDAKGTNGNDGDFDEESQTLTSDIVDPDTGKSIKVQWSLLEVKLYNAAKNGRIAPDADNYDLDGDKKPKAKKVTQPTTPTKHEEALTYKAENNLLRRTIYVPETVNPEPTSASAGASTTPGTEKVYLSRPYLILKLSYKQTDGNASRETYFRVDFLEKNGKEATAEYTYLSLLRNFRYKVNVTNIGGLGFDSEDEAKKGPAANIMYNVVVWDESTLSNVVYDGQYMLGVQNDKLLFHKNGGTFSTKVQTSWPGGFKVEGLPDWVKVKSIEPSDSNATGDTDEKIVTFEVTKSTTEQRDFSGAYIQAGRMRWNLEITQLNTLDLRIEIFSDPECTQELQYIELDERGKDTPTNMYTVGKMKFYVRVTPAARISAVNDETRAPFTFTGAPAASPSRPPIETAKEVSAGVYEFEVTADPLNNPKNPFETRQNKYHFITEQSGEKAEATLSINQTEYNIVFYEDEDLTNPMLSEGDTATYFMNGEDKQFYVRSNIPYIIWMDNQMIDKSARNKENANTDGSSKFPIVTGYYDKDGKFVKLDYDSSNTMNNWRSVKTEEAPTPNGSLLKFRAAEADALKIIYGHVMWVACTTMKSLEWKFPLYNKQLANHDRVTKIQTNFVAGYFLPEANSYPITLGKTGLLIPIQRRINHAARYYDENFDAPFGWVDDDYQHKNDKTAKLDPWENWETYKQRNQLNRLDDDDNISLEVLWTDIPSATEKGSELACNPIKKDGSAPLKLLVPVEIKGERYAYVLPGNDGADNYGNLVFCVRDKDKKRVNNRRGQLLDPAEQGKDVILWSFHLILYRPGEIPTDKGYQSAVDPKTITYLLRDSAKEPENYGTDWPYDVKVWPYALGAFDIPQEWRNTAGFVQNNYNLRDINYKRVGMYYQFGRKDPFPRYINAIGRPTRFVGHEGRTVDFKFLKSTTISLRESIEYPMVLVGNAGGHQWLTEGGKTFNTNISLGGTSSFGAYGLWGGGSPVGNESSCSQRTDIMRVLTKTVFDPCPYGFRIPIPGYSSTRMFWGKNKVNADRMRMNNAVFMTSAGNTKVYNTYNGTKETLFGVWDGNTSSGSGQIPFAVATSYIAQAHYPIFMFTFGTAVPEERYQHDIHRSSPVVVRPFNNVQESDWEKYISR